MTGLWGRPTARLRDAPLWLTGRCPPRHSRVTTATEVCQARWRRLPANGDWEGPREGRPRLAAVAAISPSLWGLAGGQHLSPSPAPRIAGGILAGVVSDRLGKRASTCGLMLLLAAPTVSPPRPPLPADVPHAWAVASAASRPAVAQPPEAATPRRAALRARAASAAPPQAPADPSGPWGPPRLPGPGQRVAPPSAPQFPPGKWGHRPRPHCQHKCPRQSLAALTGAPRTAPPPPAAGPRPSPERGPVFSRLGATGPPLPQVQLSRQTARGGDAETRSAGRGPSPVRLSGEPRAGSGPACLGRGRGACLPAAPGAPPVQPACRPGQRGLRRALELSPL